MSSPKKQVDEFNEEEAKLKYQARANSLYTEAPGSFGEQFVRIMKLQRVQKHKEITGQLEMVVKIPPFMRNGHGTGHGGVIAALHDISQWYGVYTLTGKECFTA